MDTRGCAMSRDILGRFVERTPPHPEAEWFAVARVEGEPLLREICGDSSAVVVYADCPCGCETSIFLTHSEGLFHVLSPFVWQWPNGIATYSAAFDTVAEIPNMIENMIMKGYWPFLTANDMIERVREALSRFGPGTPVGTA